MLSESYTQHVCDLGQTTDLSKHQPSEKYGNGKWGDVQVIESSLYKKVPYIIAGMGSCRHAHTQTHTYNDRFYTSNQR